MKLIDMTCPHCGASLKVDADQKHATCEHCGATFLIDDEIQHIKYDNAEQAGYEFEKGRQRAQKEAAASKQQKQTAENKRIIDMKCPRCGAPLQFDLDKKKAVCEKCGAKISLDSEHKQLVVEFVPKDKNIDLEKEKQKMIVSQETKSQLAHELYGSESQNSDEEEPLPKDDQNVSETGSKPYEPKPNYKRALVFGILAAAIIVFLIIFNTTRSNYSSTTVATTETASTETADIEIADAGITATGNVSGSLTTDSSSQDVDEEVTETVETIGADTTTEPVQEESSVSLSTEYEESTIPEESVSTEGANESDTEDTDVASEIVAGYRNENLKGRGMADISRDEPNYINVIGYVVISSEQEYDIRESDDFANEDLWVIPTYVQDKQFWDEDGTLPHKTEVVVRDQILQHEGYGAYSGYLLVEKTDDHSQYYIDVDNYITKPYWTYDLISAAREGYVVAEYHQNSDYWPVDSGGDKLEIDDGTKVLVTRIAQSTRDIDNTITDISAVVWKQWKYGYGGVNCAFNHDDLSIIY